MSRVGKTKDLTCRMFSVGQHNLRQGEKTSMLSISKNKKAGNSELLTLTTVYQGKRYKKP